jgi:outer membrane protein assembly factor BamB
MNMRKISNFEPKQWTNLIWMGIVVVAGATALNAKAATDWPGWLGPNRDGHSPDTGLLKQWPDGGPKLLWKADTIGAGWSSVAVVNNHVYTTGYSDGKLLLVCLDANGKLVWRAEHRITDNHPNYKGARSTPAVDGDRVYFIGNDGLVACHQAANGQVVWKRQMVAELGGKHGNWYYAESPLVLDNLVIVTPGGPSGIVALDKATGKDVWKSNVPLTAGYSSCIPIRAAGTTIVVNGSENGLLAVDAKTGRKVWEHDFASGLTQNITTPAYEDGFLVWLPRARGGGIGFKVDFRDSRWHFDEVWRSGAIDNKPGNYVAAQGRIFGNGRGSLTCVDLKTGKTLWSIRDVEAGQCCWADGMVYALSSKDGTACLVEPSATGGKVTGRVQVAGRGSSWSHPVVIGGRLYLRYDTNLYCYDVKGK